MAAGGHRCGTLASNCTSAKTICRVDNPNGIVSGGDSGGPVWWYHTGGVKLVGWMSNGVGTPGVNGYTGSLFQPVWVMLRHSWTAGQVWQTSDNWPSGNDGTACIVTTIGCLR